MIYTDQSQPEEGNLTKRVHRFQQILTDVANVVVGKTKPNSKIKSWMNPTIRSAIKKRNTLRKEAATRRQEWLDCCAEVAKMKKSAKEDAWKDLLEDSLMGTDERKMWSIIRSLNGSPDNNNAMKSLSIMEELSPPQRRKLNRLQNIMRRSVAINSASSKEKPT